MLAFVGFASAAAGISLVGNDARLGFFRRIRAAPALALVMLGAAAAFTDLFVLFELFELFELSSRRY